MGAGHVDINGFSFEESHLGSSSSTIRKEHCEILWGYKAKFTYEYVVECHKDHLVVKEFS